MSRIGQRTVVSARGGGRLLLGEGEDPGKRTCEDHLAFASFLARGDLNPFDQRADNLHRLEACTIVLEQYADLLDLPPVEIG